MLVIADETQREDKLEAMQISHDYHHFSSDNHKHGLNVYVLAVHYVLFLLYRTYRNGFVYKTKLHASVYKCRFFQKIYILCILSYLVI